MTTEPQWVQQAFACIRWRESRTTPTVVNPISGDSGLYQYAITTWAANGGLRFSTEARFATPAEQNTVAAWTYDAWGFGPWSGDDACWGG